MNEAMAILTHNCLTNHSYPSHLSLTGGFDFLTAAQFTNERLLHQRADNGQDKELSAISSCLRKTVSFPTNPVTEVRLRPYTSKFEAKNIFYQAEDYKKFRSEARSQRIEKELILKIEGDLLESDSLDIDFSLLTAFVSVILAIVFLFACALSVIEKAYASRRVSCKTYVQWSQQKSPTGQFCPDSRSGDSLKLPKYTL
jgi:hypothetical protein